MTDIAPCVIDSLCWLPYSWIPADERLRIKRQLTVRPLGFQGERPAPIESFVDHPERSRLGVPVRWGISFLQKRGWLDYAEWDTSEGFPISPRKLPDPYHPSAPVGQAKLIDDVCAMAESDGVFLLEAGTGTGKTAVGLAMIGRRARTALIVVHKKTLAAQWRKDIEKFLGFLPDEIGVIEEGVADWMNRKIVVAVVHNLAQRTWPSTMYNYFGTVVFDEVHKIAAQSFFTVLAQFPSRVRMAMTATPEDTGGKGKLFLHYFGKPSVVFATSALPCYLFIHDYHTRCPLPSDIHEGVLINWLVEDAERNELILRILLQLAAKGRQVLVTSARVEHLQGLMAEFLSRTGWDSRTAALYTRSYLCPDSNKRKTFSQKSLDSVKARVASKEIRMLFATDGMMTEGEDMPTLDAGVDVTPSPKGKQKVGRIRRPPAKEYMPEWHTIRDSSHPLLVRMTDARFRDYRKAQLTIQPYGTQEIGTN